MLVSALLMSVGINSCHCVLLFTLYSLLRKQPHNYEVSYLAGSWQGPLKEDATKSLGTSLLFAGSGVVLNV
ncbi:hypothetical protein N665_0475s0030 [Sinapis alba]|nr:hypothetical protein N665_0475s0030 [Sinapis alba]